MATDFRREFDIINPAERTRELHVIFLGEAPAATFVNAVAATDAFRNGKELRPDLAHMISLRTFVEKRD